MSPPPGIWGQRNVSPRVVQFLARRQETELWGLSAKSPGSRGSARCPGNGVPPRDFAESAYRFGLWKRRALAPSLAPSPAPTPYLQQGTNTERELAVLANSAGRLLRAMPGTWPALRHRWLRWLLWLAKAVGLLVKQRTMSALGSDSKGPWDTVLTIPNW